MRTAARTASVAASFADSAELVEAGYRPPRIIPRLVEVFQTRELLINLTRRELKVQHKNSMLGFAWNLMNPLLHLTIFSFVFGLILKNGLPLYALNLLSGLLVFQLFSGAITGATLSITGNAPLVTKIWFPREILPLSKVGAELMTFFSKTIILLVGLAVFRQSPEWTMLWLLVPALLITLIMATGIGMILAALNVLYRDIQHFLELALLALFWFTPIVYAYDFVGEAVRDRFGVGYERLAMLNPITPIVITFQRVLYNPTNFSTEDQAKFTLLLRPWTWYATNLAISATFAVIMLFVGLRLFARMERSFGEQL